MEDRQIILGYDARNCSFELNDEEWRFGSLLRYELTGLVSVNEEICPSVCFHNINDRDRPFTGILEPLWDKYDQLQDYLLDSNSNITESYWTLAVTLLIDTIDDKEKKLWEPIYLPALSQANSTSWNFLGFDIADRFLFSALMGTVHPANNDYEQIRNEYYGFINKYHLFRNSRDALRFKQTANQRSPEHAPFFVYGVWRIPENSKR